MKENEFNGPISGLLGHGSENGRLSRELEALTGWTTRQINELVGKERKSGIPILSDTLHGYYLPGSEKEVRSFVRRMLHRADEIRGAALAVERGPDCDS